MDTDFSTYNFPRPLWTVIPQWEMILKISTFIPIILLGIIGNILLLNVIIQNRTLQTPTNLLLANMAAADLATITICPILFMYNNFYQDFRLGPIACHMAGYLEGAFLVTSVFNLCAVSYDRLTAIVLPRETRLTIQAARIVMISSWLFGFISAIPLSVFRFYRERQWKNHVEIFCGENPSILPVYWDALIVTIVWFPLIVMVLCYSAIFWKLDRYEHEVLKREHPISVSYKKRVAKTLFIVVLIFSVLRLPFTALILFRNSRLKRNLSDEVSEAFTICMYLSQYLIFVNAAVNPLIYGLTNENFRRAYHQTPVLSYFCKKIDKNEPKRKQPHGLTQLFRNLQPRPPCDCDVEYNKFGATSGLWLWFNGNKSRKDAIAGGGSPISSRATVTTHVKIISKDNNQDGVGGGRGGGVFGAGKVVHGDFFSCPNHHHHHQHKQIEKYKPNTDVFM